MMFGWSNALPVLNSCFSADSDSESFRASGNSSFIATRRVVSLSIASQTWLECPVARQFTRRYLPIVRLSLLLALDTKPAPAKSLLESHHRLFAAGATRR